MRRDKNVKIKMQNDKAKFKSEFNGHVYEFALDVIVPKEMKNVCILICNFDFSCLTFDFE